MSVRAGIRRVFRLPAGRRTLDEHVDDEIRLHLDLRAAQLAARGLDAAAARREAERRFGPLDRARRELRRAAAHREHAMRLRDHLDALRLDLRHALRGLARERGLAAVVVLTLALGIGANAAMFGVLDRLLLSGPAHVVDAERVRRVYVTTTDPGREPETYAVLPYAVATDLREGTRVFTDVAAYGFANEVTLGRGADAERIRRRHASAALFPLLGVRPHLGRFYTADEDRPGAGSRVAVLDHGAWQRRFGGDPGIVGRALELGGHPFTVIGVAPPGFTGPELEPVELWLPMAADPDPPTDDWWTTRDAMWVQVIGRLAPGVTPAQAAAAITPVYRRGWADPSDADASDGSRHATADVAVLPLRYDRAGHEPLEVAVSRWLQGVALAVLLVACANVANLLLARAVRRRRETAVRLALGVGRGRLARLLLAEGLLLALAGGAAGLLLAWWGGQLLRHLLLPNVAWASPPVDGRVLAVALAATAATGVLVALAPLSQSARLALVPSLKDGGAQGGARRSRLRDTLTVAQAALSVLLLVGAGLFVQSLWRVQTLDLGIDTRRVLNVELSWPALAELPEARRAGERERRSALRELAAERLRALPGVDGVALSAGTPFRSAYGRYLRVPGWDSIPPLPGGGPYVSGVSADYFAVAGTRLVRGRGFTDADDAGGERVAVVNETMARLLWPGRDAVGQCLVTEAEATGCTRVVGVAQDVRRFQLREEPAGQYYLPLAQSGLTFPDVLVRAGCPPRGGCDPTALAPVLRAELRRLDPTLGYLDVRMLQERVDPQLRPWRLGATMFAVFGGLALVVAAIGLYSVMSYAAAQRAHEMGVRLALGARAADVRRLVLRAGLARAAAGIALGTAAAIAGGRWAAPLLFDTSPRDPRVLGGVAAALLLVALLASALPARRASRVCPSRALRGE